MIEIRLLSVTFPVNVQVLKRPAPMLRDYSEDANCKIHYDPFLRLVVFRLEDIGWDVMIDAAGAVMRPAPGELTRAMKGTDGRPDPRAAGAPATAPSGRKQGR